MSTYNVVNNEEEELRSVTYPKEGMMNVGDKEETTLNFIMCKRWNDGHQWGRANHAIGYTNVKNKFQWREHNTFGDWFYTLHL